MTATPATTVSHDTASRLATRFIHFLETGDVPEDLFAPDVFSDITLPTWRLQAADVAGLCALRQHGHPDPGRVPQHRLDVYDGGFVLEFTEAWAGDGGEWTSREIARADVSDGRIVALSLYCTGDWSPARIVEHAEAVTLLRP